ncbi:hypothetical protein Nepgr_010228 [Nepenthes gracilis]|uniref:Pentatricopeptide repeat-containing protein n=1 Tax=Nepenthes gracilis TaxID=150966 RepID=A0AAD3SBV5_NEPGR|nr:hypothetical protein Nepgr_010228 [Nepenthes gracilis]
MNVALLPKSVFRLTIPFPSLSPLNLKWVSSFSFKTPQILDNPKDHIIAFFNSVRNQSYNPTRSDNCSDHGFALVSALKCCSSLLAIVQGQQIHCLILKSGFYSNIFIQNSLINMYAKCGQITDAKIIFDLCSRLDSVSCNIMIAGYVKSGDLDNARQLFDVMPERGCVAYTTMIMGLAKNGRWGEAVDVFKDMRLVGVAPNEVTMASVISSYSHLGGIWDGRVLHALIAKSGLEVFVLVSTNLLHIYCICASLADARRLLNEMHEKNIVSWNVMLNGYSKAGFVDSARDLFERIPERDVVTWGTMIDAYLQMDGLSEALMLYCAMLRTGLGPNDVMIVDLVSACGQVMAICEGQQLHAAIVKTGFDCLDFIQSTIIHFYAACHKIDLACLQFELASKDHLTSWNALMAGFIRNGMIERAGKIFKEMPERDVFSWSSMISGYSQSAQPTMALELFHDMMAAGVQPNEITMVSVISAIASLGTLKEGVWAHEFIKSNSIPLNDNLGAALIDMYAKCGSVSSALEVFNQIQDRTSSVSPWNAIICGLAIHGHANLSLKIFMDLQRVNIEPNSITFIGVLTACCHGGLVEAGKGYFKIMKNLYKIDPNIKHFGCMVDLLGRAGQLQEAEEMIRSMPMKADVVIWGTLLAACRTHGNAEIGARAADSLVRLDASHGASRVLLSNLYADAEKWEDAFLARRSLPGQTMTRLPGCSGVV